MIRKFQKIAMKSFAVKTLGCFLENFYMAKTCQIVFVAFPVLKLYKQYYACV